MSSPSLGMKVKSIVLLLIFYIGFASSLHIVSDNVFGAGDSINANGEISSLVFGMPPSTNTVNMSSVEKFILSGYWKLVTDKGKIANFTSEFYTGPVNGADNHTHQLTNLRLEGDRPIQLSPEGSIQISGLTDVKTNGQSAWNDVPITISISKGRTISMDIADNGTQRHFMGQPIYGIVKDLTIMNNTPSNDTILNSSITNKSSLNTTMPNQLPPQSVNGSDVPKI